ncbi:MAG: tetratricopeptide repeat protein [Micrococcales bacterium]|nr:tetratricopeptide repeat protein [Micrococcales bacterium]
MTYPSSRADGADAPSAPAVRVDEVRVLDGPNLYFSRPAIKVSLHLPGYLDLKRTDATALAVRLGMREASPGKRGTALRQRFVMRVVRTVMRRVGAQVGARRLGVRVRSGASAADVVVAFPWLRRNRGQVAGEQLGAALRELLEGGDVKAILDAAASTILSAADGPPPTVIEPSVPVASITGTNGKTTTIRLMAHMCMTAGLTTAWSSTDGVVVMGETTQAGDYSGPAGARAVLETEGLDIGLLETARGGMLFKGMGVTSNDVSVVTNVSADHLGLQGIDTLDQLAEVKAIVTTVTRREGWVVLNGDDPRVWAMRYGIKAKPWAFTLDPDSPALWESLNSGGRGITVLEGAIVVLAPNGDPDRLVKIIDVPMTLSGLSSTNTANALAGAAAALGLGIPRAAVVEGLKTFAPDPEHNWGRLNTYTLPLETGGRGTVIMDMAHNEAGLEALLDVARGLTAAGGSVRLVLGCAGDRPDEAIVSLGEIAGRGADETIIKVLERYLRGRTADEIDGHFREGLAKVGVFDVPRCDGEVESLARLARRAVPGDTIAVMCHAERVEIDRWIRDHGGTVDDARAIRRKVVIARGEHELEAQIAAMWELADEAAQIQTAAAWVEQHPTDARLTYEYAATLHNSGRLAEAIEAYERALAAGLVEPQRHDAQLRLASALRSAGRLEQAAALVERVLLDHPGNPLATLFRAVLDADLGQERQSVADLLRLMLEHATDPEIQRFRADLRAHADQLAPPV